MSTKRYLADVLWEAANERLWNGQDPDPDDGTRWSCNAALCAEVGARYFYVYHSGDMRSLRSNSKTNRFLELLGVDLYDARSFEREHNDPQGVRYMWLLLAMHVAEDEGIEV